MGIVSIWLLPLNCIIFLFHMPSMRGLFLLKLGLEYVVECSHCMRATLMPHFKHQNPNSISFLKLGMHTTGSF